MEHRNRFSGKHRIYLRRTHVKTNVQLLHKLKKVFHAKVKSLNIVKKKRNYWKVLHKASEEDMLFKRIYMPDMIREKILGKETIKRHLIQKKNCSFFL